MLIQLRCQARGVPARNLLFLAPLFKLLMIESWNPNRKSRVFITYSQTLHTRILVHGSDRVPTDEQGNPLPRSCWLKHNVKRFGPSSSEWMAKDEHGNFSMRYVINDGIPRIRHCCSCEVPKVSANDPAKLERAYVCRCSPNTVNPWHKKMPPSLIQVCQEKWGWDMRQYETEPPLHPTGQ